MKSIIVIFAFLLSGLNATAQHGRPNIIYIMSDDHDDDAISAYSGLNSTTLQPFIQTPHIDNMVRQGVLFKNSFVSNSICSPVRATLLTGKFSHMNGVKDNVTPFDTAQYTFIKQMRAGGYQTALIGKWHLHIRPSGFDYYSILPGQGLYYSPKFNSSVGSSTVESGYVTEEITRQTLAWLDQRDRKKPFVLLMHHKAPHRNWLPTIKNLEVFSKIKFQEPPTLFADTVGKGKAFRLQQMSILNDMDLCTDLKIDPAYLEDNPQFKVNQENVLWYKNSMALIPESNRTRMMAIYAERGKIIQNQKPTGKQLLALKYQWYMQDYMACVASVDESVGQLLDYLEKNNLSENTIVVYTSDQGFYLGENGWFDKRFMYDVSMKTPLIFQWKGHFKQKVSTALVQNIDLASTFLDFAGLPVPSDLQGLSLKPLLLGESKNVARQSLYYHYYEFPDPHHVHPHVGVRNNRHKLIYFYTIGEWEFYDLIKDPGEQSNQIKNSRYQRDIEFMKRELIKLRKQYKDTENIGVLE